MDSEKQVDHIIKWVGIEKLLEGILRHIDVLTVYNKEKYLSQLYVDITKVLTNYRNRYEDVDREA